MNLEILENKISTLDSLLRIHLEIELPEKKKLIEDSLAQKKIQLILKRLFDIIVSLTLILIFSPILLVTAFLIKVTSPGPIFYSNSRVGYKGFHFRCYKFRSMVSDQEKKAKDHMVALANQEKGILYKVRNDSRVTWIGKIIRKTSIDELPQLFNVLFGDMSIIGPRPLVPFMLKNLPEFSDIRCLIRPGITGLWQIRDRANNTNAKFMIKHDVEYIEDYSLLLDVKILLATPVAVFKADGAY